MALTTETPLPSLSNAVNAISDVPQPTSDAMPVAKDILHIDDSSSPSHSLKSATSPQALLQSQTASVTTPASNSKAASQEQAPTSQPGGVKNMETREPSSGKKDLLHIIQGLSKLANVKVNEELVPPEIIKEVSNLPNVKVNEERVSPKTTDKVSKLTNDEVNEERVSPKTTDEVSKLTNDEVNEKRVSPKTTDEVSKLTNDEVKEVTDSEEIIKELPSTEQLQKTPITPEPKTLSHRKPKGIIRDKKRKVFLTRVSRDEEGNLARNRAHTAILAQEPVKVSLNPIEENQQIINRTLSMVDPFFKKAQPVEESELAPMPAPRTTASLFEEKKATGQTEPPDTSLLIQRLFNPSGGERKKRLVSNLAFEPQSAPSSEHSTPEVKKEEASKKGMLQLQEFDTKSKKEATLADKKKDAPQLSLLSLSAAKPFSRAAPLTLEKGISGEPTSRSARQLSRSTGDLPSVSSEALLSEEEEKAKRFVSPLLANRNGESLVSRASSTMVLRNLKVPEIRTKSVAEVSRAQREHPNVCGNGICEAGETCESCRKDCGVVALGQLVECSYAVQRCHPTLGKAVVLLGIPETKSKFMSPDTLPVEISTVYPIHRTDSLRPIAILPRFGPPSLPQSTLNHTGLKSFVFASTIRELPTTVKWFVNQGFKIVSATKCKIGYDGPYLIASQGFHWSLSDMD